MPLKLSDAGLAVVTAVAGRLPLRLRGSFLTELAASFSGHEGEGLRRLAVEAAKWVVRIEAAESRASIPARVPAARREVASANMPSLHSQSSSAAISLACASVIGSPIRARAASRARAAVSMWSESLEDIRVLPSAHVETIGNWGSRLKRRQLRRDQGSRIKYSRSGWSGPCVKKSGAPFPVWVICARSMS